MQRLGPIIELLSFWRTWVSWPLHLCHMTLFRSCSTLCLQFSSADVSWFCYLQCSGVSPVTLIFLSQFHTMTCHGLLAGILINIMVHSWLLWNFVHLSCLSNKYRVDQAVKFFCQLEIQSAPLDSEVPSAWCTWGSTSGQTAIFEKRTPSAAFSVMSLVFQWIFIFTS